MITVFLCCTFGISAKVLHLKKKKKMLQHKKNVHHSQIWCYKILEQDCTCATKCFNTMSKYLQKLETFSLINNNNRNSHKVFIKNTYLTKIIEEAQFRTLTLRV